MPRSVWLEQGGLVTDRGQVSMNSGMDYQPHFLHSLSLDRLPPRGHRSNRKEFQTFCQADPFDQAMVPGG
jgi:hypothetical protein